MIRILRSYFITHLIIIANLFNRYFSINNVSLMKEIDLRENLSGHEQLMNVHYELWLAQNVQILSLKVENNKGKTSPFL